MSWLVVCLFCDLYCYVWLVVVILPEFVVAFGVLGVYLIDLILSVGSLVNSVVLVFVSAFC